MVIPAETVSVFSALRTSSLPTVKSAAATAASTVAVTGTFTFTDFPSASTVTSTPLATLISISGTRLVAAKGTTWSPSFRATLDASNASATVPPVMVTVLAFPSTSTVTSNARLMVILAAASSNSMESSGETSIPRRSSTASGLALSVVRPYILSPSKTVTSLLRAVTVITPLVQITHMSTSATTFVSRLLTIFFVVSFIR